MQNILVITKPDDNHAIYTKLALEKKGHRCTLWQTADFPTQQMHTVYYDSKNIGWHAEGVDLEIKENKFDVVWHRRPRKPVISASIHAEDKDNAEKECTTFLQSLLPVIAPDAKWINPPTNVRLANSKLLQLKIAAEIGFSIPTTLISNNPCKIKTFIEQHGVDGVIYKTLYPMMWAEKNDLRLTYTNELDIDQVPSDFVLKNTPGIFQKKMLKAYELRVTYFGEFQVAAKLYSQDHPQAKIDWRSVAARELMIEEYILPDKIHLQCVAFMKKLGLVFGCFDFIVTPDHEYIFLEINEAGQFLWLEEVNPTFKMLDIFTDFIISKSLVFEWKNHPQVLTLSQFTAATNVIRTRALESHVQTGIF